MTGADMKFKREANGITIEQSAALCGETVEVLRLCEANDSRCSTKMEAKYGPMAVPRSKKSFTSTTTSP